VFLEDLCEGMHLNKEVTQLVMAAFEEDELGVDDSQYGIINALSRLGTHNVDIEERIRLRLMEAAGVLSQEEVHRCPVCLSIIYGKKAA